MQIHKYSDQELIHLLQSKDEQQEDIAIRDIYHQYYGLVESLVVKNSGNSEDAKSIFHDGLIAVIHQVQQQYFKLTSTLKTYLYSICRNKWLMELRKRKNKKEVQLITEYEWIPTENHIDKEIELDEGQKVLVKILQQIGEDCSQLIRLYYYLKLKMSQITEQLNIPNEAAAKNRKARCLKKLRNLVLENNAYNMHLKDYLRNLSK